MNIDKLAVAANLLGGFDELSDILGVDENLLEKAIGGFKLGSRQSEELTDAYGLAVDEGLINEREVNGYTSDIERTTQKNNQGIKDGVRLAIANGQIDLDEFKKDGKKIFFNVSEGAVERMLDWLSEDVTRNLSEFLNAAFSWDVQDSEFWRIFREVMYNIKG